jgi:transposase InsO family protein
MLDAFDTGTDGLMDPFGRVGMHRDIGVPGRRRLDRCAHFGLGILGHVQRVMVRGAPAARNQIATWKEDYNRHRPHSALGNIPPAEFAMKMRLEMLAA